MILELTQPWPVTTPKGPGLAMVLLDYGPEHHLMFVVALDASGEFWTFEGPEVRLRPNRTLRAPRGGEAGHHTPEPSSPTAYSPNAPLGSFGQGTAGLGPIGQRFPRHPLVGHYLNDAGDCVVCGATQKQMLDKADKPCQLTVPSVTLPPLPYKI